MTEFEIINKQEIEKNHKLARTLRDIGIDICNTREIEIFEIKYERVNLESESWININFEVSCYDPRVLAQINFELSQKLANTEDYINSEIEYIPSFISGVNKYADKFHRFP